MRTEGTKNELATFSNDEFSLKPYFYNFKRIKINNKRQIGFFVFFSNFLKILWQPSYLSYLFNLVTYDRWFDVCLRLVIIICTYTGYHLDRVNADALCIIIIVNMWLLYSTYWHLAGISVNFHYVYTVYTHTYMHAHLCYYSLIAKCSAFELYEFSTTGFRENRNMYVLMRAYRQPFIGKLLSGVIFSSSCYIITIVVIRSNNAQSVFYYNTMSIFEFAMVRWETCSTRYVPRKIPRLYNRYYNTSWAPTRIHCNVYNPISNGFRCAIIIMMMII